MVPTHETHYFGRYLSFSIFVAKIFDAFFQNFVFFVFSLVKTKNENVLSTSLESLRKTRVTRAFFNQPLFDTNLYKFSFLSIAIKLLNSFIYSNVKKTEIIFRSAFQKVILTLFNANSKHWT
jgi:hypothetical protein